MRASNKLAMLTVLVGMLAGSVASTPSWAQSASNPEVEKLVQALSPRRTRGLGAPVVDPKAKEVVDRLQAVRRTRGLSLRENDELFDSTKVLPQADVEILFAFNSAQIDPQAIAALSTLGEALNSDALKTSKFIIGGHTDAKGTTAYNQALSDRRAQAIADYLVGTHKIDTNRLIPTGFGPRKLKVPGDPLAAENRRVQIVTAPQ
jgi:outer membrane protein OmpA-like peptidoglycan-associated protein